ncbi:MAG: tetratricopeptide repeat protein, partial [Myxococcales bacterium]|nr:tetratricopeptide repeat protein [Myxococcales bacterium]
MVLISGCPDPHQTCEPGSRRCPDETVVVEVVPPLSVTEVESRLEVLGAAFAEAAADGLDAGECSSLVAGYQALYDRDTKVMAARFNVAAVHEACGAPEKAESIYTELGKRGYAPALNNLGVLAWQAGDHKRAFELFEHSVAADQTHALA